MICQQCKDGGWSSRVHYTGSSTTLIGGAETYWDERGDVHIHDPNTVTKKYHCSLGHTWAEKNKARACPTCDGDEE